MNAYYNKGLPPSLNAELLAIFIRSGSTQHSAVELAHLLLQHFGSLNAVFDAELPELSQFHGIGPTKYSQLMAVKELGRRYSSQQLKQQKLELNLSAQLLKFLQYAAAASNRRGRRCGSPTRR